jgi:serine/threonine-protein kinase
LEIDVFAAPPGTVLGGKYKVVERLDAGGMGVVYSATDRHGRPVALKIIKPKHASDDEVRERFRREREILHSLDHPAVVKVYSSGELPGGHLYLEMELLRGETLKDRLRRGPFPPQEFAPVLQWIASALEATHALGVIHRDLKPANIFLVTTPPGQSSPGLASPVKVLDFGISRPLSGRRLTKSGLAVGTPRYMPPEQLLGKRDLDPRVDVYTLGVVSYEAIAGRLPFKGRNDADLAVEIVRGEPIALGDVKPELGPELAAVLKQAMAKTRELRFGSVRELADAFALAAHAAPLQPNPPTIPAPPPDGMDVDVELGGELEEPERDAPFSIQAPRAPGPAPTTKRTSPPPAPDSDESPTVAEGGLPPAAPTTQTVGTFGPGGRRED